MNKNIIITILIILVLGMGGYLVYDKVINKEEATTGNNKVKEEQKGSTNNDINNVTIEQKDENFFKEYLKVFTDSCDGKLNVMKNTENFTNKDISNFVSGYYNLAALQSDASSYTVSVSEVDSLIYKYFNKQNVVLESNPSAAVTITKEGLNYKLEWTPMGCSSDTQRNPVVTYNGENVTVKYELYANMCEYEEDCGPTGKYITYYLKYNNGNYNLVKIEG